MGRRRPYKRYSPEVHNRVKKALKDGKQCEQIAALLGVKRITAISWVRIWETGADLPGRSKLRKRVINEAEIDEMVSWVENDSSVTLSAIKLRLSAEYNKTVSTTTIAKYLDCRLLTLKKLHSISETMNSASNKKLRRNYVLKLLQLEAEDRALVWIDETNFNLFCSRSMGRSVKGTRARAVMVSSKGRNLHIIGGLRATGLLGFTMKRGSYTSDQCNQWMRGLLLQLQSDGVRNPVIVCDNAPCHSRLETVFLEDNFKEATLLRLGPYSPALNPIEGKNSVMHISILGVWSMLKAHIKTYMRENYREMLGGDPEGQTTKREWRMRFLERAATASRNQLPTAGCIRMIDHVSHMYAKVLKYEDI